MTIDGFLSGADPNYIPKPKIQPAQEKDKEAKQISEFYEKEKKSGEKHKQFCEKIKPIYATWREKALPVLIQTFNNNPDLLQNFEYAVPADSRAGGSFYNASVFDMRVRKEGEKYFIDRFVEGQLDEKGAKAYELTAIVENILDAAGKPHLNIKKTERSNLIKKIKEETGINLRKI